MKYLARSCLNYLYVSVRPFEHTELGADGNPIDLMMNNANIRVYKKLTKDLYNRFREDDDRLFENIVSLIKYKAVTESRRNPDIQ